MKKKIIVVAALSGLFSFAAFSFINWEKTDVQPVQKQLRCKFLEQTNPMELAKKETFYLGIRSRFYHTLTKEQLSTVKELVDLLPKDANWLADEFYNVKLGVFRDGEEVVVKSENQNFNQDQLDLLNSADYSGDMYIYANFVVKESNGSSREDYVTYYITVVPETQAKLEGGMGLITDFIRKNCKREIASVKVDSLKPGKIEFTVSKAGVMEDFKLLESSGNVKTDSKILKSLSDIEAKWTPALNAKGEAIEQRFVLSFGLEGC